MFDDLDNEHLQVYFVSIAGHVTSWHTCLLKHCLLLLNLQMFIILLFPQTIILL